MKKIEITHEAFNAFENAQIKYLESIRQSLGNLNIMIKIGDDLIHDREELQAWQIKNGIL